MYLSNFVDTLKDLLIENSLSQSEFAEILKVKPATVSRYLSGSQTPDIFESVKIADYFNCSLDYLFGSGENYTDKTFHSCPEFKIRFAFLLKHFDKKIKDIAAGADIAQSAMYKWLRGNRKPSMDSIIKLAKYFDCSIDFILGRVDFD